MVKNFDGRTNTAAGFIGGIDAGYTNSGVYFMQKDASGFASNTTYLMNASINGGYKRGVTGTGNVGIGTTSPGGKLLVSDDTNTLNVLSGRNWNGTSGVAASGWMELDMPGTQSLNISDNLIVTGGNVGIGTTSPTATLDVNGAVAIGLGGIKWKLCSGTTASANTTSFAHGLDWNTIGSVSCNVSHSNGTRYTMTWVNGSSYITYFDNPNITMEHIDSAFYNRPHKCSAIYML